MNQFISPPPVVLTQPMTTYTQWNTPGGAVPLVGYPSAYPHVVDLTRRSYAAEVLPPAAYQAMNYQPQQPVSSPAPAAKTQPRRALTTRRASGGGGSVQQKQQPTPTPRPDLVRYDESIKQAMGVSPKRPDWSTINPFTEEAKRILAGGADGTEMPTVSAPVPVVNAAPARQTSGVAPVLDTVSEYVPEDYITQDNATEAYRRAAERVLLGLSPFTQPMINARAVGAAFGDLLGSNMEPAQIVPSEMQTATTAPAEQIPVSTVLQGIDMFPNRWSIIP